MKPLLCHPSARRLAIALLPLATCPVVHAAAKVESQDVGPAIADAKYYIGPGAIHTAIVAPKGSRLNVVVDGVAGPRVDEVLEPDTPYVDPRPFEAAGREAGTLGINVRPKAQVMFSADGKRYAYVARTGSEAMLCVDGKEMLRFSGAKPGNPDLKLSGEDVRIDFTGADGRHVLLALRSYEGFTLYVDGQKWPGYFGSGGGGTEGTIDPLTSPDGEHIAYTAMIARDKRALIVDGKDAGYLGDNLQYTPDSKHLMSIARSTKGTALLMDGKPVLTARELISYSLAPAGTHFAAIMTHFNPQGARAGAVLVIDGRPVEASLSQEIRDVMFSPDGKHYAAICGQGGRRFAVVDGKKGQEYFDILPGAPGLIDGPRFSGDSSKFSYTAMAGNRTFAVVNEDESDAFYNAPRILVTDDGKHVVLCGRAAAGDAALLVIDGRTQKFPTNRQPALFSYSPDQSHYTYTVQQEIFVDDKGTGLSGQLAFSPDSKHYAVVGGNGAVGGLFVDGTLVFAGNVGWRAFTPDGQHLYWTDRAPRPNAEPGNWDIIVYVDGKPALRFDDFQSSPSTNLRLLYGQLATATWKMPRGWSMGPDGALTVVGPVGDVVKRHTITPTSDTNIGTMLEEAKAADEKAKSPARRGKQADAAVPPNGAVAIAPARAGGDPQVAVAALPTPNANTARRGQPAATANDSLASTADTAAKQAKAQADLAAAKAKAAIDSLFKRPSK